jgi:hypothetical protein
LKAKTLVVGHDRYIHYELKRIFDVKYIVSEEKGSNINWSDLLDYNFSYDLDGKGLSDGLVSYLFQHYQRYSDINSRRYAAINAFQGEILSGMLVYAYFFLDVIFEYEIELIIFQNCPHEAFDYVIYLLAKYHSIKVVMTHQGRIENRFWITDDLESFGNFEKFPDITDYEKTHYEIPADWFDVPMEVKRPSYGIWNVIMDSIRNPLKIPVNLIRYYHNKNYQSSLFSLSRVDDYGHRYIYVPLHLQPELTTSAMGGFNGRYSDQIQILEQLREYVPKEIMLIIKENPKQTFLDRGPLFFKRLNAISNVKLAGYAMTSRKLIEHSLGVATITGTAGWESICLGKPCLVFGNAWYQSFPNVTKFDETFSFAGWLSSGGANIGAINEHLATLLRKAGIGVVDPDLIDFLGDEFDKTKNSITYANSVQRFVNEHFG